MSKRRYVTFDALCYVVISVVSTQLNKLWQSVATETVAHPCVQGI